MAATAGAGEHPRWAFHISTDMEAWGLESRSDVGSSVCDHWKGRRAQVLLFSSVFLLSSHKTFAMFPSSPLSE